jgi:hypothetical protein
MTDLIAAETETPFDAIARQEGYEQRWSARELAPLAGYASTGSRWDNFKTAVEDARLSIINSLGETAGQHNITAGSNIEQVGYRRISQR